MPESLDVSVRFSADNMFFIAPHSPTLEISQELPDVVLLSNFAVFQETIIEKIWDGIYPVKIVNSGPNCPLDCVKCDFNLLLPPDPTF